MVIIEVKFPKLPSCPPRLAAFMVLEISELIRVKHKQIYQMKRKHN